MRFSSLFYIVAAVIATPLFASDKSDSDARAALAMAKAKAARPAVAAQTRPIPYADAVKVAKREGKAIFVTVGMDCRSVCAGLRPGVITCHESTFEGVATRRAMLLIPSGSDLWKVREWQSCPPTVEVKAEVEKHIRPRTEAATAPPDWDQAVTALLVAMTSLEFEADDTPQVQYRQVCENGVCRLVPVGYSAMPTTSSGGASASAASPPVARESAAGGRIFRARFPRVAAFRQRVRGMVGLPAPQVRGQFFDAIEADLQATQGGGAVAVSVGSPAAAKAGPQVVGAGRERRLLKAFLARHGVPQADLDAVQAKFGDGSIWATLLKILIEEGLPMLLEFIQSLLSK